MIATDRILFVLLAQLLVLSRFSGRPIDTVRSPWSEVHRSSLFTTQKPYAWSIHVVSDIDKFFTSKPLTWKPWDRDILTWKPPPKPIWPTWDPVVIPTWDPVVFPTWKPFTLPPYKIPKNTFKIDDIAVKVLIIVPVVFISVSAFLCKFYACRNIDNNINEPPTIIHPPPSPEPLSQSRPAQYTILRNERFEDTEISSRTSPWTIHGSSNNQNAGASSNNNAAEKPPGYFEVVLTDIMEGNYEYPNLHPPDSPPPRYEESAPRY